MEKKSFLDDLNLDVDALLKAATEQGGDSPLPDNIEEIRNIGQQIKKLWFSLVNLADFSENNPFEIDFKDKWKKKLAPEILTAIAGLIKQLNDVSDGTYHIDDWATPLLEKLANS